MQSSLTELERALRVLRLSLFSTLVFSPRLSVVIRVSFIVRDLARIESAISYLAFEDEWFVLLRAVPEQLRLSRDIRSFATLYEMYKITNYKFKYITILINVHLILYIINIYFFNVTFLTRVHKSKANN